ncbi:MAG TPA: hypothetical protein VFT22_27745 [Kofleriaceae bacterium]|nr:hypothetical protein [Kofleriaceae bacterium]
MCPGYYAVGEEICAAYCIDAEIEREREEREYEIADWIVETCLTFGASVTTAYRVAALFLEALENEGKVSLG